MRHRERLERGKYNYGRWEEGMDQKGKGEISVCVCVCVSVGVAGGGGSGRGWGADGQVRIGLVAST